jgi:hypothetical protein
MAESHRESGGGAPNDGRHTPWGLIGGALVAVASVATIVGTLHQVGALTPLYAALAGRPEQADVEAVSLEAARLAATQRIEKYCGVALVAELDLAWAERDPGLPRRVVVAVEAMTSNQANAHDWAMRAQQAACSGARVAATARPQGFLGGWRALGERGADSAEGLQDEGARFRVGTFQFTERPTDDPDHAYLSIGAVEFDSGDVFLGRAAEGELHGFWRGWNGFVFADGGFAVAWWDVNEGDLPGMRRFADGSTYVGKFRHARRIGFDLLEDGYGALWGPDGALVYAGYWELGAPAPDAAPG